jgi:hypothetical protein
MDMLDSAEPEPVSPRRRRVRQLIDEFLGRPQRGDHKRRQVLQDELLPSLLEDARLSWLLTLPHQYYLYCVYWSLAKGTENAEPKIRKLKTLLEEMRVLDLVEAVGDSPDLSVLMERKPAHEVRLLSYSGHARASEEFPALLRRVIADPAILAQARQTLDDAADTIKRQPTEIIGAAKGVEDTHVEWLNPRKELFCGLGTLFSGLVFLTADGAATPTVVRRPSMSLALLSSFAGGIAAVDKGIGDLRQEVP